MEITKYIGRPYETFNCFDLVKEFYLDVYGLDLRHYYEGAEIPPRKVIESLVISNKGDFQRVANPLPGDIVVVNLFGYSCHIGVVVPGKQILHTIRKVGSCMEPIKKYEKMIEGFYRHRETEK